MWVNAYSIGFSGTHVDARIALRKSLPTFVGEVNRGEAAMLCLGPRAPKPAS
jgi:hypothetical protein